MEENPLKDFKKPLRALSLVIAIGGSLILLIFTFMINDALDKTQVSVTSTIDGVSESLSDVENVLVYFEEELDTTNRTIDELEGSFEPLAEGLSSTADALEGMAGTLAAFSLPGLSLGGAAAELEGAADSLDEAAAGLEQTGFDEHKANIADLKGIVDDTKEDIASQRKALDDTKKSVEDIFGLMKMANVMFFLVVISMFVILSINSLAGLI